MTDTEMLDWLIQESAYLSESYGVWHVMHHVGEDEFETLGKGATPREAIENAAKGE